MAGPEGAVPATAAREAEAYTGPHYGPGSGQRVNITSAVLERDLKASAPDPRFLLDPPSTNRFVSAPSVSFIQHKDRLGVELSDDYAALSATASSAEISEEFLERSRRDAERYPGSPRAHVNLGHALMNCGRLDESGVEFERALD